MEFSDLPPELVDYITKFINKKDMLFWKCVSWATYQAVNSFYSIIRKKFYFYSIFKYPTHSSHLTYCWRDCVTSSSRIRFALQNCDKKYDYPAHYACRTNNKYLLYDLMHRQYPIRLSTCMINCVANNSYDCAEFLLQQFKFNTLQQFNDALEIIFIQDLENFFHLFLKYSVVWKCTLSDFVFLICYYKSIKCLIVFCKYNAEISKEHINLIENNFSEKNFQKILKILKKS